MNTYICEEKISMATADPKESVTVMLKQSEETLSIINSNLSFVLKHISGEDYDDCKFTPPENMLESTDNVRCLAKVICNKTDKIMEMLGVN